MFGFVKTATYWIHLFHALQNHHESHHIIVVHPGAKVHQHGPVTEDLDKSQRPAAAAAASRIRKLSERI